VLEIQKAVIEKIKGFMTQEEVFEYLREAAKKLDKPKFEETSMTLREASLQALKPSNGKSVIRLQHKVFQALSKIYGLTSGLHVIAAPSGHGKTLWAMEWAKETAKMGKKVLFLSLEMSAKDLGARVMSEMSEIELQKIVSHDFVGEQIQALSCLVGREENDWMENIFIDAFGSYDFIKIQPRLWEKMMQHKPDLVIVDYVQMIYDSSDKSNMPSRVLGNIARDLKLFADNTSSAVLLLSQINREGVKDIESKHREDDQAVLLSKNYIKESGGIVEAADSIQLVCMPWRLLGRATKAMNYFQVTVDKSRRLGTVGTVLLPFDAERMGFIYGS